MYASHRQVYGTVTAQAGFARGRCHRRRSNVAANRIAFTLHEHTGSDVDGSNELRDAGDIHVDETYSTSEYLQLGEKRRASIEEENSIVGGLDGLQLSEKLGRPWRICTSTRCRVPRTPQSPNRYPRPFRQGVSAAMHGAVTHRRPAAESLLTGCT